MALRFSALTPDGELPGKSNYFLGNKPENWRTNVPNHRKVIQRGVYKGVDVVYYGTQRELEYDLVISPGANPSVVRFSFDGSKNLRTDSQGDLLVGLSDDAVRLHKPVAYQEIDGQHRIVAANYTFWKRKTA